MELTNMIEIKTLEICSLMPAENDNYVRFHVTENQYRLYNEVIIKKLRLGKQLTYVTPQPNIHDGETSHEVLGNGLNIEKEIAGIMKKHKYTDRTFKRYLNLRQKYWKSNIFSEILLDELGLNDSESWDIFNYCFQFWYYDNIGSKNNKKRSLIVQDFLKSSTFWKYVMNNDTVSKIGLKDSMEVLNYWDNVDVDVEDFTNTGYY